MVTLQGLKWYLSQLDDFYGDFELTSVKIEGIYIPDKYDSDNGGVKVTMSIDLSPNGTLAVGETHHNDTLNLKVEI